jgi:cytochrome c peroxidase
MPQIGPGKADGSHPGYWRETGLNAFLEDFGRGRVTFREKDLFKFRTPSLRNVTLTGPWGHSGAYKSLEAVVRHHLDPVGSLEAYQMPEGLLQPLDAVVELTADGPRLQAERLTGERLTDYLKRDIWVLQQSELRHRIASANELPGQTLTESEVGDVLAFLETLADPAAGMLEGMIPSRVPSGLPVED